MKDVKEKIVTGFRLNYFHCENDHNYAFLLSLN